MIPTSLWLEYILSGFDDFINPEKEYALYKKQGMKKYYSNFLNCSYNHLYHDCFLDEIEKYKDIFYISDFLLSKLVNFREKITKFHDQFYQVDDQTLLKRPEWEEIKPLAKECIEELNKLKNK